MKIGAAYHASGDCTFVTWAPVREEVVLRIVSPRDLWVPMERLHKGYWRARVVGLSPEARYFYRLDGNRERPDPASHYQPDGVHGPSQVVNHHTFEWQDTDWKGLDLSEMITYELHVGTFSHEGTFDGIIRRLNAIREIGINAIEIMPIGQFPGERNWGYDGVHPFAVQNSYGGPDALKRLVNACHQAGMAVILDVVYNHLGPEGNYLWDYGPYFTHRYLTPWGNAINFDGAYSDEVRNFFIENALYWFSHYHIDALRLDAVHAIHDMSATPFLVELAERIKAFSEDWGKPCHLIAESDLNDARLIMPRELGGYGLDAVWCDDFHHAVHSLLTGEGDGYYMDFGSVRHLIKAVSEGFAYSGEYSLFRKDRHGSSSRDRPGRQFVVFAQNHDQIGNRMLGERLSRLIDFEGLKLCAGLVFLSPYVPLLFMGEEYGEEAPFLYFVSHSDPDLIAAVRSGRRKEFESFRWKGEPPDPQGLETFLQCRLHWESRTEGQHAILLQFYKTLIRLRKGIPCLSSPDKSRLEVQGWEDLKTILVKRWNMGDTSRALCMFNLNKEDVSLEITDSVPADSWKRKLDSSETIWNGPGTLLPDALDHKRPAMLKAHSFAVYVAEGDR
jgi:maltooligosyltrehalose trehalohydrolase